MCIFTDFPKGIEVQERPGIEVQEKSKIVIFPTLNTAEWPEIRGRSERF